MRFGKNKGCDFLNKKCIWDKDSNNKEIKFENEFYYPVDTLKIEKSCTSGRLSKTIYKLTFYDEDIPLLYQYFSDPKLGGLPLANYCPVSISKP